jgi:hypothetical protein
MSNTWAYRDETYSPDRDLTGYDVEAADGHIGKVDEASSEGGRAHLVVDTGVWIFGKKRVIPAGVISRIDDGAGVVHVTMTKDQIKAAPDWNATWNNDEESRSGFGDYYDDFAGADRRPA